MRTLLGAALIALSMAGLTYAQGYPYRPLDTSRRQQIQQFEEQHRERQRQERTTCTMPDGSTHQLNDVMSYEGQRYRCVEVFTPNLPGAGEDQTLTVRIAGWIKV